MMRTLARAAAAGAIGYGLAAAYRRSQRPLDLRGKVAVVTGGSRGLGFLIARELAAAGARVVIAARNAETLQQACDRLRLHGAVSAHTCDVADAAQAERLIASTQAAHGAVDIVVNCAGIMQVAPVAVVERRQFEEVMAVNFWGTFNVVMAALPRLRLRRGAAVVNITSVGGVVSVPHMLPYGVAKFASVGFSLGLHAELAKDRIHVLTVVPGTMRTGSHNHAYFGGAAQHERQWFSLAASLPLLSTDAEAAARQIVAALARRQAVAVIGLPAKLAVKLAWLAPEAVQWALGLTDRMLPQAQGATGGHLTAGTEMAPEPSLAVRALTGLGTMAERRFQNHPLQRFSP